MKKIKLAINGFGRIGRQAFKIALEKEDIDIVAINDLTDIKSLVHLLKYDSVYGKFDKQISSTANSIKVNDEEFKVFAEKYPEKLPWRNLGVDVVIESTGFFVDREGAEKHIDAGAKRVIISAPSKGDNSAPTYVIGVNDVKDSSDQIINNASCTTNCIAPVMAILESEFGIEKAMMTTIHAVTADQNLVDGPHKDLRRARSAMENIVPTTTGAAVATTQVIPSLEQKFDGLAIRVPVSVGSLSDITAVLKKETTIEEVNQVFSAKADKAIFKGVLAVTKDPIVSSDIIGSSYSSIVDLSLTNVVGGNLVKVIAWYDNEWGYSNRLVEQVIEVGKLFN